MATYSAQGGSDLSRRVWDPSCKMFSSSAFIKGTLTSKAHSESCEEKGACRSSEAVFGRSSCNRWLRWREASSSTLAQSECAYSAARRSRPSAPARGRSPTPRAQARRRRHPRRGGGCGPRPAAAAARRPPSSENRAGLASRWSLEGGVSSSIARRFFSSARPLRDFKAQGSRVWIHLFSLNFGVKTDRAHIASWSASREAAVCGCWRWERPRPR